MSNRSDFQVRILSALAVPLVKAVGQVQATKKTDSDQGSKIEAETTAELLAKSVQLSVALSNGMDLKETDSSGDSIRLLLAICSGEVIADRYLRSAKSPSDNDIQKIASAMGAVLTFSDNFVASAESVLRVDQLSPGFPIEDETQISVQYIACLSPVVGAVSSFSFGRSEQKLVQEITSKLISSAGEIVNSFNPSLTGLDLRKAELTVLRGVVDLFVTAYDAEKTRLLSMDDQSRSQAAAAGFSLDPVWEDYGVKVGLVKVLASHISPSNTSASSSSEAKAPAAPAQDVPSSAGQEAQEASQQSAGPAIFQAPQQAQQEVPPPQPQQEAPPPQPQQEAPPPQPQQEAPPEDTQQSANPMSFFKAKPKEEGEQE
jgi:hypothetical protein